MSSEWDITEREAERLMQEYARYFKPQEQAVAYHSSARFEEFTTYRQPAVVILSDGSSPKRGVRA